MFWTYSSPTTPYKFAQCFCWKSSLVISVSRTTRRKFSDSKISLVHWLWVLFFTVTLCPKYQLHLSNSVPSVKGSNQNQTHHKGNCRTLDKILSGEWGRGFNFFFSKSIQSCMFFPTHTHTSPPPPPPSNFTVTI